MKNVMQVLFLLFVMAGSWMYTGCGDDPTSVKMHDPSDEGFIITGNMPSENGVFKVRKGLPANFTASGNFIAYSWAPRYNMFPNDTVRFNHGDYTETWDTSGTYQMRVRGWRSNNTYKDSILTILVDTTVTSGDSTVNFKPGVMGGYNSLTGRYEYNFKFGCKRAMFFRHLTNQTRWNPGFVVRTQTTYTPIGFDNPADTADGYWEASVSLPDSLVDMDYFIWFSTSVPPAQWDFADKSTSAYKRDLGGGTIVLSAFLKSGNITMWNQASYTRPFNQSVDNYCGWSSANNGADRIVVVDIRQLSFTNFNQIYWSSNLLGHGGMNSPEYTMQLAGSTGYATITFPVSQIPTANNGEVYIRTGKPYPELNPIIRTNGPGSGYSYNDPTYGLVLRLQYLMTTPPPNTNHNKE